MDVGVYGFVPVEVLDGSFSFDKKAGSYTSKKLSMTYKPGDVIYLCLDQIDFTQGTALFTVSNDS